MRLYRILAMTELESHSMEKRTQSNNVNRWIMLVGLLLAFGVFVFVDLYVLNGSWDSWISPTPVVSLFGLIFGFIILHWQLQEQHLNMIEANRVQVQDGLRVDIYKEIATRIESADPHFSTLVVLPSIFMIELRHRMTQAVPRESQHTFVSIQKDLKGSQDAIITLLKSLESYEIAMPEFVIFREQFGKMLRDLMPPLSELSLKASLLASPTYSTIEWPPSSEAVSQLEALTTKVIAIGHDLSGLTMDLRIAAQNYLLGTIFPNRQVRPRQPGDPNIMVTTIPMASG